MIPQAFTSRDVSDAFKWHMTLPPHIRDEIKTMEQCVSLYLRTKRQGGALPTKEELNHVEPVSKSSQEFQQTLKSLRHELEQFDFAGATAPITPQPAPPTAQALPHAPIHVSPNNPSPVAPSPIATAPAVEQPAASMLSALRLDPRSRQILNEIREGLNLSSDAEVIRMSLVLAHKSLRDLLAK